jgi:hypothetical protein
MKICLTPAILVILIIMVFMLLISELDLGITVHKAINYDPYSVVIISKHNYIGFYRGLYADIWLEQKKIKRHYLYELEDEIDYAERIKDITILPGSKEIKIEFTESGIFGSKTRTGVDLYKIE